MSKFLKILGGVFLVIIVVVAVFFAMTIPKVRALDKEIVTYFESAVPLVVANWNPEDLKRRAAPELLAAPNVDERLPKVFKWYSALGKLKKLEKPAGRAGTGYKPGTKFYGTWGEYAAAAEFEGGQAHIKVVLRKNGDIWQIMGFQIESMALLPKQAN